MVVNLRKTSPMPNPTPTPRQEQVEPASPLTVEQVAAWLKISPDTVKKLLQRGELRGYKVACAWRIDSDAVEDYLQACREASPQRVAYRPKSVVYETTEGTRRHPQTARQLPPRPSKTGDQRGGLSRG